MFIILMLLSSCSKKEFDYNQINKIDNELVNRNFDIDFIDSLNNQYAENDYIKGVYEISYAENNILDTSLIQENIVENPNTFYYASKGIERYKKSLIYNKKDNRLTNLNNFLGLRIDLYSDHLIMDPLIKSYKLDLNNQNIWVRIGLSYVLTDNGYYKDAIDYLFEAEAINPENLYVKELILKNFLLAKDTIYAREYLSQIPQDYKFNDIEDNVREILKEQTIN